MNYNGKTWLLQGYNLMDITCAGYPLSINIPNAKSINGGFLVAASNLQLSLPVKPNQFLYSGWQSWSLTSWVDLHQPVEKYRPKILNPMHTDTLYAGENLPHGSWYGAVNLPDGKTVFLGALACDSHVHLDGQYLQGWYEEGIGEWFIACGNENEIFTRYSNLLGERFGRPNPRHPYRVWCSWYSLYHEIYENDLLGILDDLNNLPFDVFQVDDGWQQSVGDWEPNNKFPSGMPYLASRIKSSGRKAGLWLSPLLVVPSSKSFHQHPEWLLRNERGNLVSAGFNWGEPLYALDTTHPGVLNWLASLAGNICEWGYDYVKLDFLYAGALPGKRFKPMPREAAYRNGMQVIREAFGDTFLLACGAPILPTLGLCDAIRIGPDVAEVWNTPLYQKTLRNFSTPGLQNALRTTLHRLWLTPLLQLDPDVVYFRRRVNNLKSEEMDLQKAMAEICRFKASSDVPAWLTQIERNELHRFLVHDKKIVKKGPAVFQVGDQTIDFEPLVSMPPPPSQIQRIIGGFLDLVAQNWLLKIIDKVFRKKNKDIVRNNPVWNRS